MPPRSTDEIRQSYLDFFSQKHGHVVIPGASLLPEEDPTVLFTTAGMHPLVRYLLGEKHPAGKRLVDVQRCVRTQDIDEVGDSSHLTFFEMLGNWSLGDYFKEGAIRMSYEFLTQVLELDPKKLAVSCFGGDDRFPEMPRDEEAAAIWVSMGIPQARIAYLKGGMLESKVNWWGPAGRTGPCGPDTEMFYWVGEGQPHGNPATNEKEWLEIWNDVFMQYCKREDGTFEPLKQQNVDTGMGLERTAQVMQGVGDVYQTDRMKPILERVLSLARHAEEARTLLRGSPSASLGVAPQGDMRAVSKHARVIVDHLRSATFIMADGVQPSNVDQGYVLRKLLRRAIRSARQIGITDQPFTPQIAKVVVDQYGHVYPHLRERFEGMQVAFTNEEEKFQEAVSEAKKSKVYRRSFERYQVAFGSSVPGGHYYPKITAQDAFDLYTTYGFPLELIEEEAEKRQIEFVSNFKGEFEKLIAQHQAQSRAGAEQRFAGGLADHSAETTKLHTATHLLNAALRQVLGPHVWQKGSNVTAERLRFDFSHPQKMTAEEIRKVEELVNDAIKRDLPVHYSLMTVEEAKKAGAIGVFEEKYGERVKVYMVGPSPCHPEEARTTFRGSAGGLAPQGDVRAVPAHPKLRGSEGGSKGEPFSLEICGGPHVAHTGLLGSFKIQKEEAVSAGVRRIKATVSGGSEEIEVAGEADL